MRNRIIRSGANQVDYSKLSDRSHPVLDAVRGDVLRDSECGRQVLAPGHLEKAEIYRRRRLDRLTDDQS